MRYYILDTTQSNNPQFYNSVEEIVKHLEGTVQRRFNLTRKQYMQNLIDLGYGYDDDNGITFTQSLAEYFNVGVISKDNRLIKTNIHEASRNLKYLEQYGN